MGAGYLTLRTRHEIARMISQRGDYAMAEAEFRSVLEATLRIGAEHLRTLWTRQQVALMMAARREG